MINRRRRRIWPRMFLTVVVLLTFLSFGAAGTSLAIQKHTLGQEEAGPTEQAKPEQKSPAPGASQQASPQAHAPAPQQEQPSAGLEPGKAPSEKSTEQHGAAPGAHGGEHGVQLPEISPTPGVTFVDTMIKLMEFELKGRTLGWRPNDILIGRFTDDINNYQLGVLEAVRFTSLRLKDSLTRMGDADTYDPDLVEAVNLFMNSAYKWWFPSAESSYGAAVEHLRSFKTKLENGQRAFYYRRDNLVALLSAYRDLLGNVNRSLIMEVGWFQTDDNFYYAKGVAHVYYEILKVCRVGFKAQLASTMHGMEIMDEILHELNRAERIEPWIILDANYGGFLANHRANLNAPLSEVAHLLMVLGQL